MYFEDNSHSIGRTPLVKLNRVTGGAPVTILANTSPNGACKVYGHQLPIGSSVTINEVGVPFVGANNGAVGAGQRLVAGREREPAERGGVVAQGCR